MATTITCTLAKNKQAVITIVVDGADFFANNPNEFRKMIGSRAYNKLKEVFLDRVDGNTAKHTRYDDLFSTRRRNRIGNIPGGSDRDREVAEPEQD